MLFSVMNFINFFVNEIKVVIKGLWDSTPIYLKTVNLSVYFWNYVMSAVDPFDPETAKAISFLAASILSIGTLIIAILNYRRKVNNNGKKSDG